MSKHSRQNDPPLEDELEDQGVFDEETDLEEGADEERNVLTGHGALGELPLPDDAHAEDLELHGRGRIHEGGPPSHRRLAPDIEELGVRALEGMTQDDPGATEEWHEAEEEIANDNELSIRQTRFAEEAEEADEDEEVDEVAAVEEEVEEVEEGVREERRARRRDEEGPASPSGSPPNA